MGPSSATESIPVLFCIDVEPDARHIPTGKALPWRGYERSLETIERFRALASAASGAAAQFTWTYRMDPQITGGYGSPAWVVSRYAPEMLRLASEGDELGLHPHLFRWVATERRWIADYDQAWVDECVTVAATAFERSLGRPCHTYRMGDTWTSEATMNLLQQLGARYELTLEPGRPATWPSPRRSATGPLPDLTLVPRTAYRPRKGDYRVADPARLDGLLIIPMTTAPVRPRFLRALYDLARHRGTRTPYWTALVSHEPVLFRRIVTDALERRASHLAIVVRSGALAVPRFAKRVLANLQWMVSHPLARQFRWCTPAAYERLASPPKT
jgi:hypothetical protein